MRDNAEMLIENGRAEGGAEALGQQLSYRFGPLPQDVLDTTAEELDTWTVRVLTADTIDDVLR